MIKMYRFERVHENGNFEKLSNSFFKEETDALDRCKYLAISNRCPVRMVIVGQTHGVILDPTGLLVQ